jgi:hypothetical protein
MSSPKAVSIAFYQTKSSSMKQTDLTDIFKKASRVCTSTDVVSPDPLTPTPSTSLAMKTPQYTEEDADVPEPAGEGDILMEYFSA